MPASPASGRPLRILFVTPYFPPQTGGVATYVESIQRLLRERGHEVSVLLPGDSHTVAPIGDASQDQLFQFYMRMPWVRSAPVKGFAGWCANVVPTLSRLAAFIRRKRIEVIALEYPMAYMYYFALLKRLVDVRIVVGVHGDDVLSLSTLPRYEQILVRRLIQRSDWLVGHSRSLLTATASLVGGPTERRSCIPYGIEPTRFRTLARESSSARLPVDGPYILTVAKLYTRKAIDVLLETVRKIGDRVGPRRFVIVGDGPEEMRLRQKARELGVADRVIFTGELTFGETARLHQGSEFFVLPSRSEPFGIALLEAMVFGKAVVATRVGGIPEFVVDGENGILVNCDDSEALGAAIMRVVGDPGLRARLGERGLRAVEERYAYERIIGDYESCFRAARA